MKLQSAHAINMKGKRVAADIEPGPQAVQDELASVIGTEAARLLSESADGVAGLAAYAAALMRWNKRMNLVGARTWREAARDLLADSLELAVFLRTLQKEGLMPAAPVVWDLGAGAGLPGIPLRLVWSDGDYHLVEARQKRSIFLADMCARLELPRTFVHGERAETFFAAHEGQGQVVVSRAFMPWKEMLAFDQGHLTEGGCIVFLTREELKPDPSLPWTLTATLRYTAGNCTRYFCAFTEQTVREV